LAATGNEGEQREMPGALDGDGEGALTLRGKPGLAARLDLAALRQEPAQAGDILVVNLINAIGGKDIHTTATTATATEPGAAAATEPASATAATTEPGAAAATEPASATAATTELTTATATAAVTTAVIGARGTVVATRRAIVRCPLRALLISHGLIPPKVCTSHA